jgi:hypothetical protein
VKPLLQADVADCCGRICTSSQAEQRDSLPPNTPPSTLSRSSLLSAAMAGIVNRSWLKSGDARIDGGSLIKNRSAGTDSSRGRITSMAPLVGYHLRQFWRTTFHRPFSVCDQEQQEPWCEQHACCESLKPLFTVLALRRSADIDSVRPPNRSFGQRSNCFRIKLQALQLPRRLLTRTSAREVASGAQTSSYPAH